MRHAIKSFPFSGEEYRSLDRFEMPRLIIDKDLQVPDTAKFLRCTSRKLKSQAREELLGC